MMPLISMDSDKQVIVATTSTLSKKLHFVVLTVIIESKSQIKWFLATGLRQRQGNHV